MGLKRKLPALLALRPDIVILSEVACPDKLRSGLPALEGLPIVWVGNNLNKGLAVVSFDGSSLELDTSYRPSNQFVAPVHVGATKPFRLLATWDHNDRAEGVNRRPGPLLRCLEDSAARETQPREPLSSRNRKRTRKRAARDLLALSSCRYALSHRLPVRTDGVAEKPAIL
jgi:hypothetical protein